MAINRSDETTPAAPTAADRSSQAFQPAAAPAAAAPSNTTRGVGISEVNGLRRAAFGRFGVGESVESYKKGFGKLLEDLSEEDRKLFLIETMNRDTDKIFMSTVLISRHVNFNNNTAIVVFALPVEASNPIEDRRVFQGNGQTNEISWAATDVLDDTFREQLLRFCNVKYPNQRVVYAGGRILPQELKSDDEQHLARILHEVDQAILTASELQLMGSSNAVVNVGMFLADSARATVNIDPTPTDRDNSVGLPVRSSLNVQLRSTKNVSLAQQNASLNNRDQDLLLARVDAYVDATYDTRHLSQIPTNPQYWQQRPATQRVIPRIVITAVDSLQDLMTPEITLMALASANVLSQNIGNWANSLRPRHAATMSSDLARMSDIGALGMMVPLDPTNPDNRPRISTDPREFSDKDFEALIDASFWPDPMYTLLVEESGERTWLTDMFEFAAQGNGAALDAVVRTADNLTGGAFSPLWNPKAAAGAQIVHNDQDRVHLGYFVDNTGKRVSLQHVDTLAILNLFGDKDMQIVYDWIQTHNPSTDTMEARLAMREQILRSTFSQVTIKGYGRYVTFYSEFMATLLEAIRIAGLTISPANTKLNDFASKPQFGVFDPNLFTLGSARTSATFVQGQLQSGPTYRGVGGLISGNYGR
jgi:hypothetical protein